MKETRIKKCPHCGKSKSLKNWFKAVGTEDGYGSWCTDCYVANYHDLTEYYKEGSKTHDVTYNIIYTKIRKTREENYQENYHITLRQKIFNHYGYVCKCCGLSFPMEFLTIDHKYNDGAIRRKKGEPTGTQFYRWIIQNNFPRDLQALCIPCNTLKGRINHFGYCPCNHGQVFRDAIANATLQNLH